MLNLWAKQVKRGGPMSEKESLNIFGGPNGEHKNLLKAFIEIQKREATKSN